MIHGERRSTNSVRVWTRVADFANDDDDKKVEFMTRSRSLLAEFTIAFMY